MHDFMNVYRDFYVLDFNNHPFFVGLLAVIIIDVILGFSKAWALKKFSSETARKGLVSHVALVTLGVIIYPQMAEFGFDAVADTFITFFILAYLASIVGNLEALGVPFPSWVSRQLQEEMKKKDDKFSLSNLTDEKETEE